VALFALRHRHHDARCWHLPGTLGPSMIKWAIIFFIISLVAGFFGFSGVAAGSWTIAKILFFIALTIFLVVLVFGVLLGALVF
jgi:uncharacterized membrane protein YtjA (UPF0391 family)